MAEASTDRFIEKVLWIFELLEVASNIAERGNHLANCIIIGVVGFPYHLNVALFALRTVWNQLAKHTLKTKNQLRRRHPHDESAFPVCFEQSRLSFDHPQSQHSTGVPYTIPCPVRRLWTWRQWLRGGTPARSPRRTWNAYHTDGCWGNGQQHHTSSSHWSQMPKGPERNSLGTLKAH